MISTFVPIKVDAAALPAVSKNCGIIVCKGVTAELVATDCILAFKNVIDARVSALILAGIRLVLPSASKYARPA